MDVCSLAFSLLKRCLGYIACILTIFSALNIYSQTNNWSNPESWPSKKVPGPMDVVHILPDQHIHLDTSPPPLSGLLIEGTLSIQDKNLELVTSWISIKGGTLQAGTEASPFESKAIITLIETSQTEVPSEIHFKSKALYVYDGGKILMHGAQRSQTEWCQLSQDAIAGDQSILVDQAVNWNRGDRVVLAPSFSAPTEYEELIIDHIDGEEIALTTPLKFSHKGTKFNFPNGEIDTRAELGLLSRSIVIQGDKSSEINQNGAYINIANDALAQFEGVEFRYLGTNSSASSASILWDGTSFIPGSYFVNNSIHHCYQAGMMIKGQATLDISRNTFFHLVSPALIIDAEGQLNNSNISDNLVIHIIPATNQADSETAGFLFHGLPITCRNNHIAGVEKGDGFILRLAQTNKILQALPEFIDNTSHSHSSFEVSATNLIGKGNGLSISHVNDKQLFNVPIPISHFSAYHLQGGGVNASEMITLIDHCQFLNNSYAAKIAFGEVVHSAVACSEELYALHSNKRTSGIYILGHRELTPTFKLSQLSFSQLSEPAIQIASPILPAFSPISKLSFLEAMPLGKTQLQEGIIADLDGSIMDQPALYTGSTQLTLRTNHKFISDLNLYQSSLNEFVYFQISFPNHVKWPKFSIITSSGKDLKAQSNSNHFSAFIPKNQRITINFDDLLPKEFELHIEGEPLSEVMIDLVCNHQSALWLAKGNRILSQAIDPQKLIGPTSAFYYDQNMEILSLHMVTNVHYSETIQIHQAPIPYEVLSDVSIKEQAGKANLEWKVPDEQNIKQFQVMRSEDGHQFTSMAEIHSLASKRLTFNIDEGKTEQEIFYRIDTWYEDGYIVPSNIVKILE